MNKDVVAEYLSLLKAKTGLTYEAIAEKSKRSDGLGFLQGGDYYVS